MWIKHPYFKYVTGTILFLILIYFLNLLDILAPFKIAISTLFFPVLIAGFLYYILKPIVRLIRKIKFIPEEVAILSVFAAIAGLLFISGKLFAQKISTQFSDITQKLPKQLKETANKAQETIEKHDMGMLSVNQLRQEASSYLSGITQNLGENISQIASALTGATTVLVVVPFVLFYFLKDDNRFIPFILNFVPKKYQDEGAKVFHDISVKLSGYIIGQITVAVVDGVLMYIGYAIIGLPYALLLAIFVMVTAVVPFFGPILGVLPALVVALTQQPAMLLFVLITLVIVQQIEGNLVAPLVLGNKLNIHPLTIILLLLVAAALYKFIGMLIAIPLYAVVKVTVLDLYQFYKRHKKTA
ncbi:AI-2E family transporter [Pontibacillus sp. HMF3514]|uniref:AI-2E family transporter n=1 Tax=Pontibacillus sp. HMF3514 TaxID=2692425 RepID=UPI00131F4DC7|nr:AI-2E family transporter [Pontibacillus sp. HMF3514]QHE52702.1 AI-2E family transporter [Pontibacillus sp. HMF3514]